MARRIRLAVDIGGTFTDVVLDKDGERFSAKILTTPREPEAGVIEGVASLLARAGVAPAGVGLVIHGTTLATNALIERKGAVTALVTTEGFRDSIEIAYEHRFEQYDIYMERPKPLVPRLLEESLHLLRRVFETVRVTELIHLHPRDIRERPERNFAVAMLTHDVGVDAVRIDAVMPPEEVAEPCAVEHGSGTHDTLRRKAAEFVRRVGEYVHRVCGDEQ